MKGKRREFWKKIICNSQSSGARLDKLDVRHMGEIVVATQRRYICMARRGKLESREDLMLNTSLHSQTGFKCDNLVIGSLSRFLSCSRICVYVEGQVTYILKIFGGLCVGWLLMEMESNQKIITVNPVQCDENWVGVMTVEVKSLRRNPSEKNKELSDSSDARTSKELVYGVCGVNATLLHGQRTAFTRSE